MMDGKVTNSMIVCKWRLKEFNAMVDVVGVARQRTERKRAHGVPWVQARHDNNENRGRL